MSDTHAKSLITLYEIDFCRLRSGWWTFSLHVLKRNEYCNLTLSLVTSKSYYQFDSIAGTFERLNGGSVCDINDGNVVHRYDDVVDMNASVSKCGTALNYFRNVN
jgi:hypothetical protein